MKIRATMRNTVFIFRLVNIKRFHNSKMARNQPSSTQWLETLQLAAGSMGPLAVFVTPENTSTFG